MVVAETVRLRIREFETRDLDALAALVGDPDQMRFYPRVRARDEAVAWLDRNRALYAEHGFGFWLVESHASSEFLGYCGIRPLDLEGAATTEIGWHTKKTSWSRGIATEAACAARNLAFGRFARRQIVALVPPEHIASRRVAEKIGMREGNRVVVEGDVYAAYVSEREILAA
jgi:RimJ/RimL family protein N-acetyltransferase